MISLREAIINEKEKAKKHKEKAEYQRNREIENSKTNLHIQNENEKAEYSEQFVEWLEDYKQLKDNIAFISNKPIEDIYNRCAKSPLL